MVDLILSDKSQHYWDNNGAQQAELDRLTKKFMPAGGCAKNFTGEVIRAINRLYYEFCNNGNCNALDCETIPGDWVECTHCDGIGYTQEEYDDGEIISEECSVCGGEGGYYEEDEYDYSLDEFFGNFLNLIRHYCKSKECWEGVEAVDEVQRIVENGAKPIDVHISAYDRMVDYVVWLVLNDEDNEQAIPGWYTNN